MGRRGRSGQPFTLLSFQDIITSVVAITILITLIMALELIAREPVSSAPSHDESARAMQEAITHAKIEIERLQLQLESGTSAARTLAALPADHIAEELAATEELLQTLKEELSELQQQEREALARENKAVRQQSDRQEDQQRLALLRENTKEIREEIGALGTKKQRVYNRASGATKQAWLVELASGRVLVGLLGADTATERFETPNRSSRVAQFVAWAGRRSRTQDYFVLLIHPSEIEGFKTLRSRLKEMGFDIGYDLMGTDESVFD